MLASCADEPPVAPAPEGFATYGETLPLRAVSPEGLVYRVRVEPHRPEATLGFWSEALRRRMERAGYRVLREAETTTGDGVPVALLEVAAPVGDRDYAYLVGLVVDGERLVIAEAAGEVAPFATRRDDVVAAITGIEIPDRG